MKIIKITPAYVTVKFPDGVTVDLPTMEDAEILIKQFYIQENSRLRQDKDARKILDKLLGG